MFASLSLVLKAWLPCLVWAAGIQHLRKFRQISFNSRAKKIIIAFFYRVDQNIDIQIKEMSFSASHVFQLPPLCFGWWLSLLGGVWCLLVSCRSFLFSVPEWPVIWPRFSGLFKLHWPDLVLLLSWLPCPDIVFYIQQSNTVCIDL